MRQFDLDKYLKNPNMKVVTRDGRSVRIVCIDMIGTSYPILVICRIDPTHDCYYSHTINGKHNLGVDSPLDLFFAPEKKEGYINIYGDGDNYYTGGTEIYLSETEAVGHATEEFGYVKTVKIEWEE